MYLFLLAASSHQCVYLVYRPQPDSNAVQVLMTKLRDVSVHGAEFRFFADRLFNFLIEMAVAELPTEDTV